MPVALATAPPTGNSDRRALRTPVAWASMLQVRELAVEVGGRYTLTDASFSLHAGDKVGLVGRNGAGKTSMLKVLAGAAQAAHGVVLRSNEVGYLPQDPPTRGAGLDGTALAHVLSGRGLDAAARHLEEL